MGVQQEILEWDENERNNRKIRVKAFTDGYQTQLQTYCHTQHSLLESCLYEQAYNHRNATFVTS